MNRLLTTLFFLFCLHSLNTIAAEPEVETVNEELAVKAIALYKQDPLSKNAMAAVGLVVNFAQQSPNIKITLSDKILPWVSEQTKPPYADELFAAYLVGDVQSQILRHKALDNPHAGMLTVLEIYELIRRKNKDFSIEFIEQMKQLQHDGKLRQHMFSQLGLKQPDVAGRRASLAPRVTYPDTLGDYEFAGIHDYEKPGLGMSIRYQKNRSQNDYFDVYVYPVSNEALEKHPKDAVMQEYGVAKAGIYYGMERGVYQEVDPKSETLYGITSNIYPVTQGIFKLLRDNKAMFSILYVTISNEYYVKLRATYPDNAVKAKSSHLKEIFSRALSAIHVR